MKDDWIYRRGDVYLADCGDWQGSIEGGIRPVVILQNNIGNRHSPTVCVAKLTTKVKKTPNQPTHYLLTDVHGVRYPMMVLAEQLTTLNKTDIIKYMAHVPKKYMDEIGRCAQIELGIMEMQGAAMEEKESSSGIVEDPVTEEL